MKLSPITREQALKILKTVLYIAISGALAGIIAYATDNKESLGVLWPIINVVLVALKQAFTPAK